MSAPKIVEAASLVASKKMAEAAAFAEKAGAPAEKIPSGPGGFVPPPRPDTSADASAAPAPAAPPADAPAPAADAPAPAAPPADDLRTAIEQNRQMVQMLLQQRAQPAPATEPPVSAEDRAIAEAVKKRDFNALEKFGVSLKDWSESVLADMSADPRDRELAAMRQTVQRLEAEEQRRAQQEEERRQQALQERVRTLQEDVKTDIKRELSEDPNLSILLNVAGGVDDVYTVIANHALETKRIYGQPMPMDYKEAARAVYKQREPELQQLLAVAQKHPAFSATFGSTHTVSSEPTVPAPAVTSSQFAGAGAVNPQEARAASEDRILKMFEAFAKR